MKIDEFDQRLHKAKNLKIAEQILNDYLTPFGFTAYAFTYYQNHVKTGKKLVFDCASAALKSFHNYYLEQGFSDIDRTLEEISKVTLPVFWDVEKQSLNPKSRREYELRKVAKTFGLNKGLSVSVYGINNDFASLTLHQRQNEHCLKNYKIMQYEWLAATFIFYHHIKRILNRNITLSTQWNLTKREKQCLNFTAQNWRVDMIAKELNISSRTVNFHIQNLNKKLGTNNKYQSVMIYLQSKNG